MKRFSIESWRLGKKVKNNDNHCRYGFLFLYETDLFNGGQINQRGAKWLEELK
jgi:hypothetical protein